MLRTDGAIYLSTAMVIYLIAKGMTKASSMGMLMHFGQVLGRGMLVQLLDRVVVLVL